jgi:hypothetical protein
MSIMNFPLEKTTEYIERVRARPAESLPPLPVEEAREEEGHKSGVAAAFSVLYCAGFFAGLLVGWLLWKH